MIVSFTTLRRSYPTLRVSSEFPPWRIRVSEHTNDEGTDKSAATGRVHV